MRDNGENWIKNSERPWDPPLTEKGTQQAKALGIALPKILQSLNLPPIAAIYSSPFYRCRQTALGLKESNQNLRVRVELGLSESINENWFRSWAVQGTDGTWGYMKKEQPELDPDTLHSASKKPVQPLLEWENGPADPITNAHIDKKHVSKSSINAPYCLHPPKFESFRMQRNRMHETINLLSGDHVNETIIMVSHGGPVTHLYESLTGNKWNVHGESKYCCYSIYQQKEDEAAWTPLVVNQVLGEEKKEEGASSTFTWA